MTALPAQPIGDSWHLRLDQELHALEAILKNPKNRDVQQWAKRRFISLTEPRKEAA